MVKGVEVEIEIDDIRLSGELGRPEGDCLAWIVFAHGSGSSRRSPRNAQVARALNGAGFGTLLFDLLSPIEAEERENVFDIDLLSSRLAKVTHWLRQRSEFKGHPRSMASPMAVGYFGASTGAAAALQACAEYHLDLFAIVSRGGRPDLAARYLDQVSSPVLLIVGGEDDRVLDLNAWAAEKLPHVRIEVVPGAGHLFEEPGALDRVTELALKFYKQSVSQGRSRACR